MEYYGMTCDPVAVSNAVRTEINRNERTIVGCVHEIGEAQKDTVVILADILRLLTGGETGVKELTPPESLLTELMNCQETAIMIQQMSDKVRRIVCG